MTDHYDEKDTAALWIKDSLPVSLSGLSRFRRWLFPALTAAAFLILIIALGVICAKTSDRLVSVEQSVSNLSNVVQSLKGSLQRAEVTAKEVEQLRLKVEKNEEQLLTSVSATLKHLSTLESMSRTVASLKCSLDRIANNASVSDGCCPVGWEQMDGSCFLFSVGSLSWNDSRLWCEQRQAHLAILLSDKEWDHVTRRTVPELFWVGLSDWRTGRWEWINRTPYMMNRRRWSPGQPDSWSGHGLGAGDEDCAHLHNDGRLNDLHCSTRLRFICQKHSLRP